MAKIRTEVTGALNLLWVGGWLFSLGYLQLGFWKGLLGLIMWPYYIGIAFAASGGG